jgi:HAD superfamily hydrolase (TIGR01509 family)
VDKKMKKPLLFFDLMDTVVVDPFFRLMPEFFGITLEELLKIKDPYSWPEFELGEIGEAEYFRRFFRAESGLCFEESEKLKFALFVSYRFVDGVEELLGRLRASGERLWVHSNYSPWVTEIRERLGLDRFFDGYAMSFDLKARKPDERAYRAALELAGEVATNCLFIDDRETNVEAAKVLGMKGIIFKSAPQLRDALSAHGIKI